MAAATTAAPPMRGIGASPGFSQTNLPSSSGYQQQRVGSPSMVDRFVKSLARNAVTHPSQGVKGHHRGASDSRTPYYSSGGSPSSSTSSVNEPTGSNSKLRTRVLAHDAEARSQAVTRQRSRTETNRTSGLTYGGIGESPVARSRQNSSSSSRSTNIAASVFSHRPSTSSATRETAPGGNHSRDATAAGTTGQTSVKSTPMPSIRGFTDIQASRPRTPLLEPFQRERLQPGAAVSSEAPRIDVEQPESYVASLGLAPLVAYQPMEHHSPSHAREAGEQSPYTTLSAAPHVKASAARRRSPSVDSYLETSPVQIAAFQRGQTDTKRTRKTSRRSRSRKGSASTANHSEGEQSLGSRFVRYDSRPMPISYSTYRFGTSGQTDPEGALHNTRRSRSRTRDHMRGSSTDKRSEEKRQYRKLVSARVPNTGERSHWHNRIPSQPLGLTWVCGARSAARHPSFYDEFEYSSYPYGRRKRSLSRSTLNTPAMSSAGAGADANTAYRSPLHYESEPDTLSRAVARRQSMHEATRDPDVVHHSNPASPRDEYLLRRRSRSLVNLRQTAGEGRTGLLISSPLAMPRTYGDDMSRPPRRAPMPDMDIAGPPASTIIPPRSMFDDIVDPQARREALFAALPPPARRSPTPNMSPNMYTTGRLLTSTVRVSQEQNDDTMQAKGDGTRSPPLDDLGEYEASRVIIRENYLPNVSSVSVQERYPVVYGRAFSTGDDHIAHSHEGEIIDYQSNNRHTLGSDYSQGIDAYLASSASNERGGQYLAASEAASRSGSGSGTASSTVPSVANSARVLDLRDENFQNLFYADPPPSKPLPDLPSSRNSPEISLYNRHRISDVPSEFIARGITDTPPLDSPRFDNQPIHYAPRASSPAAEAMQNEASEVLDMDQVPYALGLVNHAHSTLPVRLERGSDTARHDTRSFLRGISTSSSSEDESVSYATASANASSSVLDLRPNRQVHHQASFQSARSQLTGSSVPRTIQGDFTPATERDQAFYTANTERADPLADNVDDINQSLSQLQVFPTEQQEQWASNIHGRDSYIDFEAEPHATIRRGSLAQTSTHSFIDDSSDDEEDEGVRLEDHLLTASSASHYPPSFDVIVQVPGPEEDFTIQAGPSGARHSALPSEPVTPTDPSRYSSSSADLLDVYGRESRQSGRDSQASYNLDVPFSDRLDRNSSGSHVHSVSNASLLSHLDSFPEPPSTSATERANPMEAAGLALADRSESKSTLRPPRRSSLPASMHQPSKTTLASGSTSVYTFTSYPDEEALSPTAVQSSSRSSFLDLSTSPERPACAGPQSYLNFASTAPPTPRAASTDGEVLQQQRIGTPNSLRLSQASTSGRLSGLFGKRPRHERTLSDPSY